MTFLSFAIVLEWPWFQIYTLKNTSDVSEGVILNFLSSALHSCYYFSPPYICFNLSVSPSLFIPLFLI